jgi:hypothetical protein
MLLSNSKESPAFRRGESQGSRFSESITATLPTESGNPSGLLGSAHKQDRSQIPKWLLPVHLTRLLPTHSGFAPQPPLNLLVST